MKLKNKDREKSVYYPKAYNDTFYIEFPLDGQDEEEQTEIERPDIYLYENEQDSEQINYDDIFITETEPCPCCGAENPANAIVGYICPVCLWEYDYDAHEDENMPSDQNHGLSLFEARLNFRAFGISHTRFLNDRSNYTKG